MLARDGIKLTEIIDRNKIDHESNKPKISVPFKESVRRCCHEWWWLLSGQTDVRYNDKSGERKTKE